MINSMTGFGRSVVSTETYSFTAEIKAVNHRFCEINLKVPKQLSFCEDQLKKWISSRINRGKIDVYITFERQQTKNSVLKVDKELAIAYYKAMLDLANTCEISTQINVQDIAGLPGVFSLSSAEEEDQEELSGILNKAVGEAMDSLVKMRQDEGQALADDLLAHLQLVSDAVGQIAVHADLVVAEQKEKLQQRLEVILDGIEIDQNRLANELAYFADKVDINEELIRLNSHISQFKMSVAGSGPVGRKLDFILQEMLRETNTIGSKSNNLSINKLIIDVKNELERMKEQVQNVE